MREVTKDKKIVVLRPDALERAGRSIAIDKLEAPVLREAFEIWSRLCDGRSFPAYSASTPSQFKRYLRNLALIRVIDDGKEFEFRVVGDAFLVAHGFTAQGLNTAQADALSPGFGAASRRIFARVRRTKQPLALSGVLERNIADHSDLLQESLYLPLGPSDKYVDYILCFAIFVSRVALS